MAISSPINKGSFTTPSVLKELKAINVVTLQLNNEKKKRFALQKKFDSLTDRYGERAAYDERESAQERKDTPVGKSFKKFVKNQAMGLGSFLFGLMKAFITYKILEWVANPANLQKVNSIVKGLSGIFKFLNWFTTGAIDNALSGLHSLLFGGSILERVFGFFRAFIGFLGIRYLLNPLKIVKDLKSIIQNGDKIGEIFGAFRKSGIVGGVERLLQTLPKTASIFKHGLSRGLTRGLLTVFGKGGFQFLSKIASKAAPTVTKFLLEPIKAFSKKTVAGIPIVGPLLSLGINLALGDPIDKAIIKTVGSTLGMGLGGLIGSLIPGPGTIVGGMLGGLLGDWAASTLYDWVKGMFSKQKTPELAAGGIVTRPTKAIVGEAGPEAVVPLPQLFGGQIFEKPIVTLGSGLIGGMNAVIASMGPVGIMVRPFANQLFAPYTREFGTKNYVFTSDLGKTSPTLTSSQSTTGESKDKKLEKIMGDNTPKLLTDKDSNPRRRYNSGTSIFSLLGDIYNSLVNIEFGAGTTGPGGGPGGPGGADQSLTAAELDAIRASSADKRAAAHLATLEATAPQHVADVYQVILNRAAGQSGGIPAVITAKEQFTPYSAALYGSSADSGATKKYGGLGLTKKEIFELASKPDGIQQLTQRFQAGNPKVAAQVIADFEKNGPLSQSAKKFVGGAQYFLGYQHAGARRRPDGGNWFRDRYATGGVVNPVPSQNISTNKGGYASDTGLDILTPIGSRVVSPVAGTIEYAEKGHVRQMGQDANPNMPGMQDQHSVRIRLDKPFKFGGKEVKFFYATHLYQLNGAIANKSNIRISPGDLLGLSGVANNVPHVHVGFVEDREQNSFLNFQQVRSLLSGAPVQDSQQSPGTAPSTDSDTTQPEVVDWTGIAKSLGNLYNEFQGTPKTNGNALSAESMAMVQNMKALPFITDTYIMTPSSTTISNVNVITPLPTTEYGFSAFSNLDSPSLLAKRNL